MTRQVTVVDVSSFTTDAKFRTWGLAMSTAMQASRLVKTADTGQINWASVTKPVATNTKAGYEIYRFDDDMQATKPVFLRIDYGSGGVASGNSPSTWITVGTGSDGAGVITGPNTGAFQGYNVSTTVSNTLMQGMFTHTDDGYAMMLFGANLSAGSNTSGNAGWFIIDRSRDANGDETTEGVTLWIARTEPSTVSHETYAINFNTGYVWNNNGRRPLGAVFNSGAAIGTGNSVHVGKIYGYLGRPVPSTANLIYYTSDIAAMSEFDAAPWGATNHNYLALGGLGQSRGFMDFNGTANNSVFLAARWED